MERGVFVDAIQIVLACDVIPVLEVVHCGELPCFAGAFIQTRKRGGHHSILETWAVHRKAVGGPAHLRRVSIRFFVELVEQAARRNVAVVAFTIRGAGVASAFVKGVSLEIGGGGFVSG